MAFITHNLRVKQQRARIQGDVEEVQRLTHAIKSIEQICPHQPGQVLTLNRDSDLLGTNDGPKYRKGSRLLLCSVCGSVVHHEPPIVS